MYELETVHLPVFIKITLGVGQSPPEPTTEHCDSDFRHNK